ncbi:MAG: hypothetical protein M1485_03625 [Chloroflexi bacterium]|nr:hypothetical protein [Chloroflexota bacterium]MCL5611632.1 hypothetical protein [Chloroflexota bacterium]
MKANRSVILFLITLAIGTTACNPAQKLVETSTPLPIPTETVTTTPDLSPTLTEWLPYNLNNSNNGCGAAFDATLSVTEAKGLSQEELAKKLFEVYLGHSKSPDLGGRCRLEDFKVNRALLDTRISFLAAEQHVNYVAYVIYDVQIKETPSDWVAGNGEIAPNGWIVNKEFIIGVTKVGDDYVLKVLGTGP